MRYKPAKLYDCGGDTSRRWFVQYYVEHPLTGKDVPFRVEKGINVTKSAKERRRVGNGIAAHINELLASGEINPFAEVAPKKKESLRLIEALEELVEVYKRPPYRDRTWHSYFNYFKRLREFLEQRNLSALPPDGFSMEHARQFTSWLQESRRGRSINNIVAGLRTLFKQLYEQKELSLTNPFTKINKLPEEIKIRKPFTVEDQEKLRRWMKENDPELLLYVTLEHDCFIRPRELRSIMMEDIFLEKRTIRIKASVAKSRREEYVAIPPRAYRLLMEADIESYPKTWYLFAAKGTGKVTYLDGVLTVSKALMPGKARMSINAPHNRHIRALEATGLKQAGYSLYSWKDTGASNADRAGISLIALQKQMRHTDPKITMRYLNRQRMEIAEEFLTFDTGTD